MASRFRARLGRDDPNDTSAIDNDADFETSSRSVRPRARGFTTNPAPDPAAGGSPPLNENEVVGGLVAAFVVAIAAVAEITITHGSGAPKNSNAIVPGVALVISAVLAVLVLKVRHRVFSPAVALIGAFLIYIEKTPHAVAYIKYPAAIIAFGWALWLTFTNRKVMKPQRDAQIAARREARQTGQAGGRQSGKKGQPVPKGPAPNARYTPPKVKAKKPNAKPAKPPVWQEPEPDQKKRRWGRRHAEDNA